ncbi:MAG: TerC family protein [Bdellovibrionales bacterium]|nr:TerC family protein [Bdellovibrionales bacterium]
MLFPFAQYWWFYAGFIAFIMLVLVVDLGVFHKKTHAVSFKEAAIWSCIWVSLALLFNWAFYHYAIHAFSNDPRLLDLPGFNPLIAAKQSALEFLTGYVVEKSLAVDNLFIFVVVFNYFGVAAKYQHRILFYGILGALIFRAIFIAIGAALMQYQAVVVFFGGFLIITGIKMLFSSDQDIEPEKNIVLRILRKIVPITTKTEGDRFFIRDNKILYATPLFVTLIFLEFTDIIFAIDSVPAIFAITHEPLIVFTSNIFAILGLRSMYFLLAGVLDKFYLLKYGLAAVLMFVGSKMSWIHYVYHGDFPTSLSLLIISGLIGTSIVASLLFPVKAKTNK